MSQAGLFPPLGIPLTLAVLAIFIPYFGFKRTVYIGFVVSTIAFLLYLPQAVIEMSNFFDSMLNLINSLPKPNVIRLAMYIHNLPATFETVKSTLDPTISLLTNLKGYSLPLVASLIFPVTMFEIVYLKIIQRLLNKLGIYKRLSFI